MTAQLPEPRPEPAKRDDIFYCPARRRRLPFGKCLDDYLLANAMTMRRRVCYRCPMGRKHRQIYAENLPLE